MSKDQFPDCLTCNWRQPCEEWYGRIGIDEEDCRAIVGTHFCRADWQPFAEDQKRRRKENNQ